MNAEYNWPSLCLQGVNRNIAMGNAPTKPTDSKRQDENKDKNKPEAPTPFRFGRKKIKGPSSIQKLPQGKLFDLTISEPYQ